MSEKPVDPWNRVGFHRVAGAYLYGYILALGEAVLGIGLVSIVLPMFMPYPEINGFKTITAGILGFWFGVMDFNLGGGGGFSGGMMRFIGQYSHNDPRRATRYIQFYIWFQLWTGIMQVTVIFIVSFYFLVHTSLSYLTWFIISQSLVQYPGMLMIMQSCLKAFQRGDKLAWVVWLQNTVFQVSVNIICLVIGKAWGGSDPKVGELMGITIFYILSQFLDDWINLFFGGYFFNQVLKERGIDDGIRAVLRPDFDRVVVKESLNFAGKQCAGEQVLGLIDYLIGIFIIIRMPSMASWVGLLMIPQFLGHLVSHQSAMVGLAAPAISEAYNNKKIDLAQYIINNVFKWYFIVTLFMFTTLAIISPRVLSTIVDAFPALQNYEAGIVMIPVVLLVDATGPVRGFWSSIFISCDRPLHPVYVKALFAGSGYFLRFLFIWLCVDLEVLPVWTLIMVPGFINDMLAMVAGYAWIHKRVMKIKVRQLFWQGIVAPVLAAACYGAVLLAFMHTAWPLLDLLLAGIAGASIGPVVSAAIVLLSAIFVFPGTFYCPFLALWGGWDGHTLEELKLSVEMSGPSKWNMRWMFRITRYFYKHARWQDKHPLADYDVIRQQANDLAEDGKKALSSPRQGKGI